MEEKFILLNGGTYHDVVPLPDSHAFLTRLLGGEAEQRAVPILRSMHDQEGRQRVAVFVGAQHIGYLPADTDAGLLATVKACELNGALPRVRGSLLSSWEEPGKVQVRVSLAASDHLLSVPEEQPEEIQSTTTPTVAPDAPALSAGWTEDYPEWPPPKPKPAAEQQPTEGPSTIQPSAMESSQQETPALQNAKAPSLEAVMATRSAWTGEVAGRSQTRDSGWLGASARSESQPSRPSEGAEPSPGAGAANAAALSQSSSSGAAQDIDSEIVAAWTSSTSPTQEVPQTLPPERRHRNANWVLPTVGVLVLVFAAFLVWKFVFAPKTYTDSEYGYSFSYPARWELIADSSMFAQFAYLAEGQQMPSMALAGKGFDSDSPDEAAMVAVARAELPADVDRSQFAADMKSGVTDDQIASSGVGFSIVEPVYATTIGGLDGWRMTMSIGIGFYSMTMTYCVLLDDRTAYVLIAAATGDTWDDNQKNFDRFFRSFRPD